MSRDDPPYCGDCGMSHHGHHALAQYCKTCGLLMTVNDDDEELVCTTLACPRLGLGREAPVRRRAGAAKP